MDNNYMTALIGLFCLAVIGFSWIVSRMIEDLRNAKNEENERN